MSDTAIEPAEPAEPARTAAGAAALLEGLNHAQREAVLATSGPVAILAGAGTGKTTVISRRAAYAIATGVVPASDVLVVTFTDKAAGEMASCLASLGEPRVTARTFHAHALSQLSYYWPSRHDGRPMPEILASKIPIVGRLARALPGGYRFTTAKDLADEIEWSKSRRITPATYAAALDATGIHAPPIPVELFVRLYADYERAKERAGRIDFDDMLIGTVEMLEADAEVREVVRSRKRWISVDEYQDTNPLQERLLELWLGERTDLCVVGDPDQTIYTFTGATSDFLTGFADRHPGATVVTLTENQRSTPQVLDLANRVIGRAGRSTALRATRDDGPPPTVRHYGDGQQEAAAVAAETKRLIAAGVAPIEIAVLTRINAQLATIEAAFTSAGVPYQVRGQRFFDRREVRDAIGLVRRGALNEHGAALIDAVRALWATELGYGDDALLEGAEGRERAAALDTLIEIGNDLLATGPDLDADGLLEELAARAGAERAGSAAGVNLLTYHRAKGLEWDAVFLPMLEEGSLPISHALGDPADLDEERRLLYVGITRARVHLALSWAEARLNPNGSVARKRPSRFLDAIAPPGAGPARTRRVTTLPDAFTMPMSAAGEGVLAALKAWRTARAKADAVPAYVIAHDATLEAIADACPATLPALRRVKGMGPARLEKYGPEILDITTRPRA